MTLAALVNRFSHSHSFFPLLHRCPGVEVMVVVTHHGVVVHLVGAGYRHHQGMALHPLTALHPTGTHPLAMVALKEAVMAEVAGGGVGATTVVGTVTTETVTGMVGVGVVTVTTMTAGTGRGTEIGAGRDGGARAGAVQRRVVVLVGVEMRGENAAAGAGAAVAVEGERVGGVGEREAAAAAGGAPAAPSCPRRSTRCWSSPVTPEQCLCHSWWPV